jgi:hypothetical protein
MPTMPTLRSRSEPALRDGFACPQAGTHVAVGPDEFTQGGDQETHRDVGDLLGQHVRGVGHNDVMFAREGGIDVVVADAKAGDDFEFRELRQRLLVRRHGVVGDGHAADFC